MPSHSTFIKMKFLCLITGIILWMWPANERRRYSVTPSLIGWSHAHNDPCNQNVSFHANSISFKARLTLMRVIWICLRLNRSIYSQNSHTETKRAMSVVYQSFDHFDLLQTLTNIMSHSNVDILNSVPDAVTFFCLVIKNPQTHRRI